MEQKLIDAALQYTDLGYSVFPCAPGEKYPATAHGVKDATDDPDQIEAWWTEQPDANIAIATNDLLIIDVDGAENQWPGDAARAQELVGGYVSVTPRGGRHYLFRDPGQHRNTTGSLAPRVDTRATGGYILVPPSIVGGRQYQWAPELELDVSPALLPEPPAWLLSELDSPRVERRNLVQAENIIPKGQRNHALASLAGTMRRVGMGREEMLAALVRVNENRCRPPLPGYEVQRIAESIANYEPDQVSVAVVENHWAQDRRDPKIYSPVPAPQLIDQHPKLSPPLIHGLLREGETMNVIAQSKMGKSFLVIQAAISIAYGFDWLDHPCEQGNVLIVDNELHPQTSANRIGKVLRTLNIHESEAAERIHVLNLRGKLLDLPGFLNVFKKIETQYKAVILDAFYRFIPADVSENDNASMAKLYNALDHTAQERKCAFIIIHHSSKGAQGDKNVTDVGAGAGAQSRAADTHLVLRRHVDDDMVVMHAATRSWPPVEPMCLQWQFPTWVTVPEADPKRMKGKIDDRETLQERKDQKGIHHIVETIAKHGPQTLSGLKRLTGMRVERGGRLIFLACDQGLLRETDKTGQRGALTYDLVRRDKA